MDSVISTKLNINNKTNRVKIVLYEMITHGEPYDLILKKSQELDILIAESLNEMNSTIINVERFKK